ncbi:MAG: long-chain-fatty-acid--CoA ligase [Campylobacteraceae bacterium]|jgi:long-chain acyl-CoA synthetase|nr:long-chain-fatty-acid--CoA ligase [Campylobacteraceae bacterium]
MLGYNFQNFYEMVEHNAKENPKKTMFFIDKQKISNIELKQKVDILADFLYEFGIRAGDTAAIIVVNSEEFIISLLALSKLGAISVPINTFLKREEFEHILNDCSAKLLFSSASFAKETKRLFNSTKIEAIIWTEEYEYYDDKNLNYKTIMNHQQSAYTPTKRPTIDDIACIVYTSGTTGKPKGAMLSYRNMLSNMVAVKIAFKIEPKDRFIVYLPMFHTFTLTIMVMLPIYFNSSVVVIRSVFPFSNILKQTLLKKVTIFLGVPTVYNALIKAKIPWYFMWFHKVRLFISGSAPLSEKSLLDFGKKFTRGVLLEGYGLSECSPAVAVNRLEKQKPLSVGPALPGYEIKIVDDEMMELPLGEVGEIIVKGDCAMQGYLNRPEATAETLINGWVRTGDLGKLDEDGFLFIVDRKKDLIISKGINIYPREIEEILYQLNDVEIAAVIGKKSELGDEDVVAFIQFKDNVVEPMNELQIKKYLKQHLANFKIPKHIFFSKELPKNATGKVLKRILKEQVADIDIKHTSDNDIF